MNPLVSIITPCYNAEKFISQMIESVLQQSYTNWELLITNDCSTDGTVLIIQNLMKLDNRIKLFHTEKNTGHPSIPRNIALSYACGEYIAFLDSDDLWDKCKLEEQVAFILRGQFELICSYCRIIKENGEHTNRILKTKDNASYNDMLKRYELISPTIMCTKRIGKLLSFPACEKEDYIEWLRITKMGINIHTTKTVNASYRICTDSRSRNKLKMIKMQWGIYRKIEYCNFYKSCYFLTIYFLKTLFKNLHFKL